MIISHDTGGEIRSYVTEYASMSKTEQIEIAGMCTSACTLFFLHKGPICVTPSAELGFHQASLKGKNDPVMTAWMQAQYPPWLVDNLKKNGGLTAQIQWLGFAELRKHIAEC